MLDTADDGCSFDGVILKGKCQFLKFLESFVEFGMKERDVGWRLVCGNQGIRWVIWDEDGVARLDKVLLGTGKVSREVGIVGIGKGCGCAVGGCSMVE